MGRKELLHGDGYLGSYLLLGAAGAEMGNVQPCPPGFSPAQCRVGDYQELSQHRRAGPERNREQGHLCRRSRALRKAVNVERLAKPSGGEGRAGAHIHPLSNPRLPAPLLLPSLQRDGSCRHPLPPRPPPPGPVGLPPHSFTEIALAGVISDLGAARPESPFCPPRPLPLRCPPSQPSFPKQVFRLPQRPLFLVLSSLSCLLPFPSLPLPSLPDLHTPVDILGVQPWPVFFPLSSVPR